MTRIITVLVLLLFSPTLASGDGKVAATMYKTVGCQCCDAYADIMTENGFDVRVVESRNMTPIKSSLNVPKHLEGCHTVVISDYVVEAHAPVGALKRLLREKPAIRGISLPGILEGSPGMSGLKKGPFKILSITDSDGPAPVYVTE